MKCDGFAAKCCILVADGLNKIFVLLKQFVKIVAAGQIEQADAVIVGVHLLNGIPDSLFFTAGKYGAMKLLVQLVKFQIIVFLSTELLNADA